MDWQPFALVVLGALVGSGVPILYRWVGRAVREQFLKDESRKQAERTLAAKDRELATAHAQIADLRREVFTLERRIVQLGGEGERVAT